MTTDPVTLLRQAADRIKHLAAAATPGPWIGDAPGRIIPTDHAGDACGNSLAIPRRREDGLWIATMHPGIAHPLAAWLRSEIPYTRAGNGDPNALDLACAILGLRSPMGDPT